MAAVIFFFSLARLSGQNIQSMVDSLQYVKADTLDCSADLYWRIIATGDKAIPFLIEKLTDTTPTRIRWICKKTNLNVGEVAQLALVEIGQFPAFVITNIQFDFVEVFENGEGCWSFYIFFFMNENKARYQKDVRSWYEKEKSKFWVYKILRKDLTECQKRYGIDSYYRWN